MTRKWLPTAKAAEVLGVNPVTLRRIYGHAETGFLKEGIHWRKGMRSTYPRGWDVEACRETLEDQGYIFFGRLDNKEHTKDQKARINYV